MALGQLGAGFSPLVERVLEAFAISLSGEERRRVLAQATALLDRAATWSARIDLTSAREPEELVDLVFADAAAVVGSGLVGPGQRWVDVGSGMGAPGLPLALLSPGLAVTLVEPRAKRVAFLRTLLATLEPLPVRVERARSEALGAGSFDVAISRATLPPPEWLAEGARLATSSVWVLLARGAAPSLDGWGVARALSFRWPLTGRERRAVAYQPAQGPQNSAENKK
jgi:16S rRNA (guanine527-N7)-methyltransferase